MWQRAWGCLTAVAVIAIVMGVCSAAFAMSMREAVVMAVQTNPEIGEAIANREATEFELRQGRGLYLPQIDVEGRAGGHMRDSPTTRRNNDQDHLFFDREASIIVRQLLFDGFGTDAEIERQASRVDGASFRVLERSEIIALAVIREYLDIIRLRQIVAINRDNVAYHERVLARIDQGITGGTLSIADRQQAEERLFASRSRVAEAMEELKAAETRFVRLVGQAVGRTSTPARPGRALPGHVDQAISVARNNNPSVKSAVADVDAAYALVKAAESRFYPRLSLEGRARAGRDLDGIRGDDHELRAGVVLDWNLYRGGIDRANRQEQIRRFDEATMRLHSISREVEEAVRLAWDRRRYQLDRLGELSRQEAAAEQLLRSYSDQFAIGQRSLLDVLDTQNELITARIQVVTAEAAVRFAEYRILAAVGTLLAALGVSPPPQAAAYAREQARVPPAPPPDTLDREPPPSGLGPLY